ncbi:hypothetical protein AC578_2095 [Pseudocercospora eumusae]|uniref:Uncharacterized protein n=1 Tax=Pseudocercospora eumusae TaxID=321146 RepID=A0A139HQ70_9PEZI|nr:hypothetical protein AC578_2095 [Pseudocercospora eumusae]
MPPKKAANITAAATAKDEARTHEQADDVKEELAHNVEKEQKSTKQNAPSKKRKKDNDQAEDAGSKAPCRSRRTAGSERAKPSDKQQLLNYLLSKENPETRQHQDIFFIPSSSTESYPVRRQCVLEGPQGTRPARRI